MILQVSPQLPPAAALASVQWRRPRHAARLPVFLLAWLPALITPARAAEPAPAAARQATQAPQASETPPSPEAPQAPLGLSGGLALGLADVPTYEGSARRRRLGAPDLALNYRTVNWGSVQLGRMGLQWGFDREPVRAGLLLGVDPGRRERESSAFDPTPGDPRLAGMGQVRASAEWGVMLGLAGLSLTAHQSIGQRGHRGWQVDVGAEASSAIGATLGLRVEARLTWADRNYMQTYFGVTPAQSQRSGFQTYTADAGWRRLALSLGAEYSLAGPWKLQGELAWARQLGDAQASPLVQRKSSGTGSIALNRAF